MCSRFDAKKVSKKSFLWLTFDSKDMSARANKIDYYFLNEMSTATEHEILQENRKRKRRKDVYEAEEILAEKKV